MLTRRTLLSTLSAPLWTRLASAAPPMKVTRIETVYWKSRDDTGFWPHWTWVKLTTDSGLEAIGETYPRNSAEADMIHSYLGAGLIGRDPRDIEGFWASTYQTLDVQVAGGTEIRALSALDLALWDLLGKSLNAPVYRLIGGRANQRVRLYNTCFPHKHDFLTDPVSIMKEVRDGYGIKAIKVWPFDAHARASRGSYISQAQIDEALKPIRMLRDAFGLDIEILVEFHALWSLTPAIRIAKALEPYKPMWIEDVLKTGNFDDYRRLRLESSLPVTLGERMAGKLQFQAMLDARLASYVMFDVCWCGGLTEARKITAMADAHQLPFAAHTAGGPLLFYASTHLSTAMPNLAIQESCQRFYERDWPAMLESPLLPKDGTVTAPEEPGFGMRVKPEAWNHPKAIRRVTGA